MWQEIVLEQAAGKMQEQSKAEDIPKEVADFISDMTEAAAGFVGLNVNVPPLPESLDTANQRRLQKKEAPRLLQKRTNTVPRL
jgi:hypothetical protein